MVYKCMLSLKGFKCFVRMGLSTIQTTLFSMESNGSTWYLGVLALSGSNTPHEARLVLRKTKVIKYYYYRFCNFTQIKISYFQKRIF